MKLTPEEVAERFGAELAAEVEAAQKAIDVLIAMGERLKDSNPGDTCFWTVEETKATLDVIHHIIDGMQYLFHGDA